MAPFKIKPLESSYLHYWAVVLRRVWWDGNWENFVSVLSDGASGDDCLLVV